MAMTIKLVRHGESEANLRYELVRAIGDHNVSLTAKGRDQTREAGCSIGAAFVQDALRYCSPYRRARETMNELLVGAGMSPADTPRYEDPRLREVEHGYQDVADQEHLQRTHGLFYYRFHGGESPADCFDRTSGFIETLMRQFERKQAERALIVTHGLTIRCFVMRFLHLSVEEFDSIANPANGDVITLAPRGALKDELFRSGHWGVAGLRLRTPQPTG